MWITVIYCSLPPKSAVIFSNKEYETVSDAVQNGRTMYHSGPNQKTELNQPSERNPFVATLVGNERVTASDHWQDVRLLTFDITGSHIT